MGAALCRCGPLETVPSADLSHSSPYCCSPERVASPDTMRRVASPARAILGSESTSGKRNFRNVSFRNASTSPDLPPLLSGRGRGRYHHRPLNNFPPSVESNTQYRQDQQSVETQNSYSSVYNPTYGSCNNERPCRSSVPLPVKGNCAFHRAIERSCAIAAFAAALEFETSGKGLSTNLKLATRGRSNSSNSYRGSMSRCSAFNARSFSLGSEESLLTRNFIEKAKKGLQKSSSVHEESNSSIGNENVPPCLNVVLPGSVTNYSQNKNINTELQPRSRTNTPSEVRIRLQRELSAGPYFPSGRPGSEVGEIISQYSRSFSRDVARSSSCDRRDSPAAA
eukprot:g1537.t1